MACGCRWPLLPRATSLCSSGGPAINACKPFLCCAGRQRGVRVLAAAPYSSSGPFNVVITGSTKGTLCCVGRGGQSDRMGVSIVRTVTHLPAEAEERGCAALAHTSSQTPPPRLLLGMLPLLCRRGQGDGGRIHQGGGLCGGVL